MPHIRTSLFATHGAHGLDGGADQPGWRLSGACRQLDDPDVMYPNPADTAGEVHAIAICNTPCPVKNRCGQWALDHHEPHGVWGGMTERERRHRRAGKAWRCPGCGRRHHQRHWGQVYCTDCRTPRNTLRGVAA